MANEGTKRTDGRARKHHSSGDPEYEFYQFQDTGLCRRNESTIKEIKMRRVARVE